MLRKVRADAHITPVLADNGFIVREESAPFVDLCEDRKQHSRNARELRRVRRRLSELGELRFELLRGSEASTALRAAIELKRDWLSARGLASQVIGHAHWEGAIHGLVSGSATGHIAAARLTVGDAVQRSRSASSMAAAGTL